jgi:hypothetical protein
MVLLKPMLDGEIIRTCSCGHIGLGSPVAARASFQMRSRANPTFYQGQCVFCRRASSRKYHRENRARMTEAARDAYARRVTRRTPEEVEVQRGKWRAAKVAQKERDSVGVREAKRVAQRRFVESLSEDRRGEMLEDRRMNYRLSKEREGEMLTVADPVKTTRYSVLLPVAPFHEWLRGLIAWDAAVNGLGAKRRVAARLGVSERRLTAWFATVGTVDEALVDRAVSREGSYSLLDVYPEGPDTVTALGSDTCVTNREECVSPGCSESRTSGRFCVVHAARLARVRAEYDADAMAVRSRIGRRGTRSTCCAIGCLNGWDPAEQFCPECLSEHDERG